MGAQEWLIIAVVVLVLFGGSQLPKLARSLGEAQKEFKKGMDGSTKHESSTKSESSTKRESTTPSDQPAKTDES
jgi:sec-independent protein translocase protein TatA